MQQLQEPILNKIQPGQTPIFIVSPNITDGEPLALLLSNHILVKNAYKVSENINHKKNYFFSDEVSKLSLKKIDDNSKKTDGHKTTLKFIFDKAFDSKQLWGLQIDYKLFFELEADKIFPDAFFIFQYGTKIKRASVKISEEDYLDNINKFHKDHLTSTALFHINNVIYTPEIVLQHLAFEPGTTFKHFFDVKEIFSARKIGDPYPFDSSEITKKIKQELDKNNFIARSDFWFTGKEFLFILICGENITQESILKKTSQFTNSFIQAPLIHIVCKNEYEKRNIQRSLINSQQNVSNIIVEACSTNISSMLNGIINSSKQEYFILDDLSVLYSSVSLLSPFKNIITPPDFVFSSISENKINEMPSTKITIVDILTVFSIPGNIAFSKKTWQLANGFDESLAHKIFVWDFTIRCLEPNTNYALEVDAIINDTNNDHDDISNRIIPFENYKPILDKHAPLFEDRLKQIIKIFSENQYIPQYDIKKLNQKIFSLQSLLSHSKDELGALNRLGAELQQRINLLESRWHFKLANKFDRIRKIFFKKKTPGTSTFKKLLKFLLFTLTKPGFRLIRKIFKNALRKLYLLAEDRKVEIIYLDAGASNGINTYNDWINKKLDHITLKAYYDVESKLLKNNPKISIVMPVYDPPVNYLKYAIESVQNQLYTNWELCMADDCSPNPQIKKILEAYALKDSRIKVVFREENGHISATSNSALALATGEYILFMDHDDLLTTNCCFEIVKHINEHPEQSDIIYSDEDKVDGNTYLIPHFKPDWAPDNLLSRNYFGHVVVMKKKIVDELKGFRLGFEGSQDYDIILRATELTSKIGHIPKVLYHWRIHEKSAAQGEDVKPYAYIAAKKALEEALMRRDTPGEVKYLSGLRGYQIIYDIVKPGKVSIIIPTKDHIKLLGNTIDSIIQKTSYTDYEIIVINNNSVTKEFFDLMDEYRQKYSNFKCIDANIPFNFSKLMNIGVRESKGDYILLLNNDVEIIHNDWLTKMVSFAQHEKTGAVGVKLLYPDDNIQHAGVIIGLGGVAGHSFVNNYKDDAGYFNYIQSTNNYSAVTAACLMIRRSVYDEVGGMDEKFEVEYNDVDFCLKILDHGYYNVYMPDVELYHYESATRGHPHQSKESFERHVREIAMFKSKWDKYIKNDPYYNPNLNLGVHDFSMDFSK
ncbi:MAG: glycosyl transferase family 2 [Flavipsychrobacter sp.]|nr:glycosyl transferase family 2 [Flavipsychrobacter sp.]